MMSASCEQFQRTLAGKQREELVRIAVSLFQEKENVSRQLTEYQNASSEMSIQFQQMKQELESARKEIETLQKQNRHLTGVRDLREKELFGRSTEKAEDVLDHAIHEENANPDPLADDNMPEDDGKEEKRKFRLTENGSPEGRKKKEKGKRQKDLSGLPSCTVYEYDIEELDRMYGENNWRFSFWEVTQTVEHIRASTYLKNTYRPVVSVGLEHDLERPFREEPMLPKSIASPSLLAWIMQEKFELFLPTYRQEHDADRFGFPLSRQTMSNWIISACQNLLLPVYQFLKDQLRGSRYQQCDETTYLVIRDGRKAGSKSYVWTHRTSELAEGPAIILYCYEKTRCADHLRQFYEGLTEKLYLTCDGYGGYPSFAGDHEEQVVLCGCLMHVRRYFVDALSVLNTKNLSEEQIMECPEAKAMLLIGEIYQAENLLGTLTAEERYARRQKEVKERYDAFIDFVKSLDPDDPSASDKLNQAIRYTLNQEPNICRFLEDGNIPIDNGACERDVRPIAQGRRNYLFSNTISGAESNMIASSLIRTAKENGADPYYYLKYLLEQMPKHLYDSSNDYLFDLMPWSEAYQAYEIREREAIVRHVAPSGNQKPKTPGNKDHPKGSSKKAG